MFHINNQPLEAGRRQNFVQTGTFVQNLYNVILAAIFWLLDAIFLLYALRKSIDIKVAKESSEKTSTIIHPKGSHTSVVDSIIRCFVVLWLLLISSNHQAPFRGFNKLGASSDNGYSLHYSTNI